MNTEDNKAALSAVSFLLRPLVRMLIRLNIPFGSFAEAARQAYVRVADEEFQINAKKQTTSRIAVLTGLTRKDVARIRDLPEDNDSALNQRFSRCSRVISGWLQDDEYSQQGKPLRLELEDAEPSFRTLVNRYSGDMPMRAMLDELLRIGAVSQEAQQVVLNTAAYVPGGNLADKLAIMGRDGADFIDTIDHNLIHEGAGSRFQLKVEYDNLSDASIEAFRAFSDQHSLALLRQYDAWLAGHDRDQHSHLPGTGRYRAGVGIYYFEQDLCSDAEQEAQS